MRQNAGGVARGIQVTRLWFDPAAGSSKGGFTDHVYSCHAGKGGSKGLNPFQIVTNLLFVGSNNTYWRPNALESPAVKSSRSLHILKLFILKTLKNGEIRATAFKNKITLSF